MLFIKNRTIATVDIIDEYSNSPESFYNNNNVCETNFTMTSNGNIYQMLIKFDFKNKICYGLLTTYYIKEDDIDNPCSLIHYDLPLTYYLIKYANFRLITDEQKNWRFPKYLYDNLNINIYPDNELYKFSYLTIHTNDKLRCVDYQCDNINGDIRFYYKKEMLFEYDDNVYNIFCKFRFDFHFVTLTLYNMRSRYQDLSKDVSIIQSLNDDKIKKLLLILTKLNFKKLDSDIVNKFELNHTALKYAFLILNSTDLSLYDEAKLLVDIKHTQKRFEFLKKYGNIKTIQNGFKIPPFTVSHKIDRRTPSNPVEFYINHFFGMKYNIASVVDLYRLELLLFICSKYENYESRMRQLVLEVI